MGAKGSKSTTEDDPKVSVCKLMNAGTTWAIVQCKTKMVCTLKTIKSSESIALL